LDPDQNPVLEPVPVSVPLRQKVAVPAIPDPQHRGNEEKAPYYSIITFTVIRKQEGASLKHFLFKNSQDG
jgi:hypothetical protein